MGTHTDNIAGSWVGILTAASVCSALHAQTGSAPLPRPDVRVDVALAIIPVSVFDARGEPVEQLGIEHFRVFEDGVEQKITFLAGEDLAVSVCLVFDGSSSMRKKIPGATRAIASLLKAFDHPEDEFSLVAFNERPRVLVHLPGTAADVERAVARVRPVGRTSLLDAIHLARTEMRAAKNTRKVIVIISDGGDNHSRLTRTDITREMREADVQVYAMSLATADSPPASTLAIEELNGPILLREIARETGGRFEEVPRLEDLPATCVRIARRLHHQYVLGYVAMLRDGRSHRIRISVTGRNGVLLHAVHRPELFIPGT